MNKQNYKKLYDKKSNLKFFCIKTPKNPKI